MSFRRLVTATAFLAVFTMALRVSTDSDTWWHLRAGAWMIEHRQILSFDPFSLTRMGSPWIYPGWLAQIVMAGLYRWLGFAGLNLLTASMVTLAFVFLGRTLEGPDLWRAAVLLLAAVTSAVYWSARPQILSFALTGGFIWILERWRQGDRNGCWALPPTMALWVNLHGGFAIGFLLIGLYGLGEGIEYLLPVVLGTARVGERWRACRQQMLTLTGTAAVTVAAVGLNPHGPVMLLYPFKTVSIGVLRDYIQEWQSPNFHNLEVQPFLWLLFLTALALALSPRRPHPTELLSVFAFAYLGFLAGRNIALFALVAAPVLARHGYPALTPLLTRFGPGRPVPARLARSVNSALFALLVLAAALKAVVPLSNAENEAILSQRLPSAAVRWIETIRPPGPLFNSYNWGGYVVWSLYPDYPSFVDGRTDLFNQELLTDYLTAWRAAPGWEAVLDRWGIRLALLEVDAPLVITLQASGWEPAYQDDQAVVLVRSSVDE
ncbi:MAG: hypothetical protein AB1449_11865 [Chloroflexota bacterium]